MPALAGTDDWHIFHRLNEFLATEPAGSFVQTGTVFELETRVGDKRAVWICVTPACDLVPRKPSEGAWEHSLDPIRPMIAIRGQLIGSGGAVLKQATRFHHVYLTLDGDRIAVKVVDPTDPNAKLELFLLDDMGRNPGRRIQGDQAIERRRWHPSSRDDHAKGDRPIRGLYASRILQLAGSHLSRIGVDFVDMP